MKTKLCIALVVLFAVGSAKAQEGDLSQQDVDSMVDTYARCTALWEWTSGAMKEAGKEDTADYLHNMANGSRTAAQWILSSYNMLKFPEASPKKLGDWEPYLAPKIDGHLGHFKAMAELGASIKADLEMCTEMSAEQAKILEEMRKQYVPAD
jgi:hypothetical protein